MPFAEIYAKSNFSFLEAASHPEELVHQAAELEYRAIAITDRNSLAGVVRAHTAAKETGIKLLVGAEIVLEDAATIVLLPTDRAAYGRLCRLITEGRRRAEKGECLLRFDDLAGRADGLLACMIPEPKITSRFRRDLNDYHNLFGGRCYLAASLHYGPDDRRRLAELSDVARKAGVPLVATGAVRYHVAERQALQDVLTAVRHHATVAEVTEHLFANAERYLKSPEQMEAQFADAPGALRRTLEIADRIDFSLDQLRYEYPEELAPAGQTPNEHLRHLTWAGAKKRYPGGIPDKVCRLLRHELDLIEELHYEAYFLTVWDLVRFARSRGILCQGRGSAANSAVCYCLGVTAVDPDRVDLLFERFVSRERNEAPDIDVDFEHERREEVLQYLYDKYGRERAGMTAEVITYRPRSAVRDVGKALGLSLDRVDNLAKRIEHFSTEPEMAQRCREAGIDPDSLVGRQLVELVDQLVGFPRHLSQHTGGMVMTQGPLCEMVPIENAAMPDRTVIQWNKDDLDELGILKVDCLALGMLTAIRKCFGLIEQHTGERLTLATVPPEDPQVYAMIRKADTMGVFQIESRAQMSMLPRLKPRCFYDLVIEVAIVRPGPIQGNMVHPYLRRRNGEEPVSFPNDAVREVLEKTLGVPLFQEQAMRLAVVAAGFTPGEADQLRRAMGAWRRPGVIDEFRRKLIEGMRSNGFSQEYAEAIFQQIRGFGDYGFPESHAASFALLVYVSCWLKYHHQAAFTAAVLNSQPMGFYAPAQLIRNARDHGVEVRPVDVNHSHWDCTLEVIRSNSPQRDSDISARGIAPGMDSRDPMCPEGAVNSPGMFHLALRLGMRLLRGMSQTHAEAIEQARTDGPFGSMEEFTRRTGLSRAVATRLAKAGAFKSFGLNRRDALWHALGQDKKELPLFDNLPAAPEQATTLPEIQPVEEMLADYRTLGMTLGRHPIGFLRPALDELKIARADDLRVLPKNRPVAVAGVVLVRQRPGTAKGITFVTLEDETGVANLIIRPDVWKRFRNVALRANILLVRGRLQREGRVIHVLASYLEDLSGRLTELAAKSRNFC
ncbi:MAG: error-prone DNA polymerase [Planctomycetaceae bacterium]|nr:error-prone DNA polymerase [Planctomycetaceae bacterium]